MEPRILSAKCRRIVEDYSEVLKYILDTEIDNLTKSRIIGDNEFEVVKKVFEREGMAEGMRRFLQRLNDLASRND